MNGPGKMRAVRRAILATWNHLAFQHSLTIKTLCSTLLVAKYNHNQEDWMLRIRAKDLPAVYNF